MSSMFSALQRSYQFYPGHRFHIVWDWRAARVDKILVFQATLRWWFRGIPAYFWTYSYLNVSDHIAWSQACVATWVIHTDFLLDVDDSDDEA